MASLASINIKFSADLEQFSSEIQNSSRKIKKLGGDLQTLGAGLSIGLTAPILAFGVASVQAFDDSAQAIAQVDAALKSTGGTVGFTSQQLQEMASGLQAVTTFDDDQILREATANLLTFNKITGETFAQAQKAALDLSTRLGGDLQTAALQIGKALQDPVKGIGALSKAGVSFSAEQKGLIKSMVATNDIAGAQSLILKELNNQFGGSAEAAAKVGTGSFKQLTNQVGDLSEEFGAIIVEGLQPFIEKLKDVVTYFQQLSPESKKVIAVVAGITAVIGPAILAFGTIVTLVPTFVAGLASISAAFSSLTAVIAANPIGAIAVALGLVVGAFFAFNTETQKAVKQQSEFNNLNQEAAQLIVNQKAKVDSLVATSKSENTEKKEKIAALKELNRISPEYLGNLNLENINTDAATKALARYNTALLNAAKAKIASNKIDELRNKLAESEVNQVVNAEKLAEARKKLAAIGKGQTDALDKFFAKQKQQTEAEIAKYQKVYDENEKYLKLLDKQITTESTANDNKQKYLTGSIAYYEALISQAQKEQKEVSTTADQYDLLQQKIDGYQKKIDAISKKEIKLPKPEIPNADTSFETPALDESVFGLESEIAYFENRRKLLSEDSAQWKAWTELINNTQLKINAIQGIEEVKAQGEEVFNFFKTKSIEWSAIVEQSLEQFGSSVAVTIAEGLGNLLSGSSTIFNGLNKMLGKFLKGLGEALIQAGMAGIALRKAFTNPFTSIAVGVALIAFSTAIENAFAQTPAFATGGIVGGSSFYGDRILARVNSGELILNGEQQRRLSGMLDAPATVQPIVLQGGFELTGDVVRLMLERNEKKNNRIG